ncbi:MAG: energy transducer TonB [Ignavibacteriales bacterium]|nr:energy transducer TonB [Ignavibacteriales bacterium]
MKNKYLNILIFVALLSLSCSKNTQSPTNTDENKPEPAPYVLGDTSSSAIPPPDFVPYAKAPTVTKIVEPQVPEYAKVNNIEGNVFVKCWVTTVGTVRRAVVIKTDNEIFNRPSLEASIQWEFTPALKADSTPVDVWVSIPFRFRNN